MRNRFWEELRCCGAFSLYWDAEAFALELGGATGSDPVAPGKAFLGENAWALFNIWIYFILQCLNNRVVVFVFPWIDSQFGQKLT